MAIRNRTLVADYLKVGEEFVLMGAGFTDINESPNANTNKKQYVNDKSPTSSITSYEPEFDFETDKHIAHSGGLFLGYDYYSLKNDENRDFIYVVVFQERYIYSKVGVKQDDIGKSSFKYKDIISPKKGG